MLAELLKDEDDTLRVKFTNDTKEAQFLNRYKALLGEEPDGDFLALEPTSAYSGPALAHELVGEALVKVEPGESVTSDAFRLAAWYKEDPGVVQVRYRAWHPLSGKPVSEVSKVTSSPIEVDTQWGWS